MNKQGTSMKRGSTFLLRGAIVIIAAIVLAICAFALPAMWMAIAEEYPQHTYVFYSILIAFYVATLPFFYALYQAMKLLNYVDTNKAFSMRAVKALRRIAGSAFSVSIIFISSLPFFYTWADIEDAPGLVLVGIFLVMAPFIVGVFAALLQRVFCDAIDIKKENDLTV